MKFTRAMLKSLWPFFVWLFLLIAIPVFAAPPAYDDNTRGWSPKWIRL